ncbi:Squalene-hopene cyclase C-terminal domain-containing protein [Sphingomonas sp. NFR04]|uniref:hypothetical protein n=1 Tax=Sphingomonas sp. NFR04 TaxID=1566283 RepID=UPI0008EFCAFF|nr:hypothetical protein [Sphingomonas sp. NFR04]SFJ66656.1 Squalene-hopene cyclase C-terminal domain-containing protein [Sphingomonas sp. NFR04]
MTTLGHDALEHVAPGPAVEPPDAARPTRHPHHPAAPLPATGRAAPSIPDATAAHAAIVARAVPLLERAGLEGDTAPAPHDGPTPALDAVRTRDLFVQILIADALLDADLDARHPVIETTVRQIVRHRQAADRARRAGADRYHDLSGDVDELAQILLLFARLSRRDLIAAHCAPPLAVLLAYAEADGVLPTWVLPNNDAADAVETVATLVYALARWDARRFLGMIVAAARWVADRQQPDGSWASAAGIDPHHGTWLALRLLGAVMPNHPAVARGARFLHANRSAGSGWGCEGTDPLATALAVLALRATRTELPHGLVREARAILTPGAEGWQARPLLRFTRTATGLPVLVDHGSSAVTALFALKASEALEPVRSR